MRKIRKVFVMASVVLMVSVFLTSFTNTASAARTHGEVIFPEDLVVGEVVSVYMGPTYGYRDALVIEEGFKPRLILLSNLGNTFYACDEFFFNEWTNIRCGVTVWDPRYVVIYTDGATRYETSNLRDQINARTAGHAPYIFNISAPTLQDVARGGSLIDHRIAQGGPFWTRSEADTITTRWGYWYCRKQESRQYKRWRMWFVNSNGAIEQTSLLRCKSDSRPFRRPANYRIHRWEVARYLGVRPVFNLKSYMVLKYDSKTNTFRVTTLSRYNLMYRTIMDTKTATTNLETIITNNIIEASDNIPPIVNLKTVSGARATSGISIQAIVTVSDNTQGPFTYSINGGPFRNLPSNGIINLPVTNPGNNVITVRVKDVAGNIGSDTIVIRKL